MFQLSEKLETSGFGRWFAVAALFLAAFMTILDVTIVNLALPAIKAEFSATTTELEWVLVIYVLTFAAGLLPFGRFGDVFGRKRIFIFGKAGFLASSAVCGLASGIETLIVARALQGLTASMMVPQVLAIVHVIFTAEEKGKVIGLFGTISALGAVAGPLIGGALISVNFLGLEWRPIFLLNVPLGLISLIAALVFVPDVKAKDLIAPDWSGSVLFAIVIACAVYPLTEGRHLEWPWWCFALFGASFLLATLFIRIQFRRAVLGLPQILPARLLRDKTFLMGLVIVSAFFSGVAGVFFMLAIFLQSGFGLSALQAGLAMAPYPLGVMIASTLTSWLGSRWLDFRLALGASLLFFGMLWLRAVLGATDGSISPIDLLLPMLTVGLGMGTAIAPMFQGVLIRVHSKDSGAGSGVLQAFQQVGIAIGIGVVGQIFFASLESSESPLSYIEAARGALVFPLAVYLPLTLVCVLRTRG